MLIKATQKNTRQTPRKVRLIANTVRKLSIEEAFKQLSVIEKKATIVVSKVLKQAVADAMHNHGYQLTDLTLDNILVTEGPRYRRFRAVSRGRAHNVIKRTCHITVILKTAEDSKAVKADDKVKAEAKSDAHTEVKTETTKLAAKKKVAKKKE
jgi:large subunit ribosomal protein L22